MANHFDVSILGSGMSGSIMAMILQQSGLRTVVIDRRTHPRFAIGESSTPAANLILRSLAQEYSLPVLHKLSRYGSWCETFPDVGCGLKRGFSYFAHTRDEPFKPATNHSPELLVAASARDDIADTQWLRSDVDQLLARTARGTGSVHLDATNISCVRRQNGVWVIDVDSSSGSATITADFIVDASGPAQAFFQGTGTSPQVGSLQTRSRAIYAHVRNLPRWEDIISESSPKAVSDYPFRCDDAALHHLLGHAWMWWLRFRDDRTSVGLVLDDSVHPLDAKSTGEQEWELFLSRFPSLTRVLHDAQRVAPEGGLVRTGRLQRLTLDVAGDGWALLPHTAGFVDPLHSTGIAHSLSGIERLAQILTRNDPTFDRQHALSQYANAIVEELRFIDELVSICYRCLDDFDRFTTTVMCYFAAATTWERRRLQSGPNEQGLFLCADDSVLRVAVREIASQVDVASSEDLRELASRHLAPFNSVGLFEPAVPNMYACTALPDT